MGMSRGARAFRSILELEVEVSCMHSETNDGEGEGRRSGICLYGAN